MCLAESFIDVGCKILHLILKQEILKPNLHLDNLSAAYYQSNALHSTSPNTSTFLSLIPFLCMRMVVSRHKYRIEHRLVQTLPCTQSKAKIAITCLITISLQDIEFKFHCKILAFRCQIIICNRVRNGGGVLERLHYKACNKTETLLIYPFVGHSSHQDI